MTLSLANSVEDLEQGCSGCNTQSDSDSESLNDFKFTDVKDVKLMTGAPATTTSIVFKDSPYPTVGDTINIHIGKANINGKEFENFTSNNLKIPCENNVATITYQPSTAAATGCAKPSIGFIFCQSIRDHYKLSMFLFSTVVVLCLITPAAIIISAKNHSDGPATSSTTTSSSPSAPTQKHHILRRGLWGARSPLNPLQPLRPPLAVLIVTETGTATCGDLSKCFGAMQNLQNSHVGIEHLPDIRYNFVVGGDGNVYEGRGWLVQNERKDNSVEVAFMGEFSEQPLEQFMALTGPWLIEQGVKGGYLRNDVKVGCANRTGGFLCGEASLWAVKGNGGGDDVETNQVEAENPVDPIIHYKKNHTRFFTHRKVLIFLTGVVAVGVVYLIIPKPIEYGSHVPRANWGARASKGALIKRSQPATLVVIKHTWGDTCFDYESCKSRVKSLQENHMNEGKLLDIAYNFLVGGDGRIYEGIGWNWENFIRNDSIDIAFIGNFNYDVPSDKMLSAAVHLIIIGWYEKYIDKNTYYVVSDNQTRPVDSPDNEPDALPDPASQVKPPIAPKKSSKKRIIWLTFLAFITSLAGVVIGLRPWETVSSKEITTQLPETTTQFDNYGAIVSRENWGAKPSKSPLQPMNKAATLVVINHTGGKSCSTFLQCSQRVKDIQLEHFNVKNYRDISYNFLLGGDGRIYLGRGWRVTNEGRNESVDFAFIGNFNDLEPSNEILNMANWLISAGGWEDPNAINLSKYYVISNNLTEPSNSPGAHLYAKMNDFVFHTFKLCYANCSDGSYVQSKICPPEEAISC